ncbi:ADP-ribosylglycohydrolase family protein [Amycolatopsis sp. NPDC058986]|uniref:ADP-ribosylglycohydrolase family protein n=1 Tax=unclassified Amycolatopsis TaxID=2618356 RepID=UPI003671E246
MSADLAYASLTGLAVGDAFGAQILMPGDHPSILERRLPAAPWQWTDDTLMACSLVSVLARHGHVDRNALAADFAARYDADRGYGSGVSRLLNQIRAGQPWQQLTAAAFGGKGSWGNGAAMRVAPLGAWFCHDLPQVLRQAELSAVVTHSHLDGVAGAVAAAAALTASGLRGPAVLEQVVPLVPPGEVRTRLGKALKLVHADPRDAADELGIGREVAAHDTVPLALWIACTAPSYVDALWTVARLAEDVDTVGAIVGGVLGAGSAPIPGEWLAACEPLPAWLPGNSGRLGA